MSYQNHSIKPLAITILLLACIISIRFSFEKTTPRRLKTHHQPNKDEKLAFHKAFLAAQEDFQVASKESFNFFDNVRSSDWNLLKDRVKNRQNHFRPDPASYLNVPGNWYMGNFESDFTCPHERKIGGLGDGSKWICDPHRIGPQIRARKERGGNGCLVYSVGSNGNFLFELSLKDMIGEDCEVHVFDVVNFKDETPPGVFFHSWGFKSKNNLVNNPYLRSFEETVAHLGHKGKVIDIFKIDCEGCEWDIYQDLLSADVRMNQILVEVHNKPRIDFFESLQRAGYVTFHKESNLIGARPDNVAVEYAMVKLAPEFFQ